MWAIIIIVIFLIILLLGIFSSDVVVKTNFSPESKKDATVFYYLPQSLIKIKAAVKVAVFYDAGKNLMESSKIIEQTFVVSTEMIADTENLLSLNYIPNPLMSDDIKYAVNAKGLLETVNITTEDRTNALTVKLAEAPKNLITAPKDTDRDIIRAANIVKIKDFSADFVLKASSVSFEPDSIKWNLLLLNELGMDENPKNLSADFFIKTTNIVKNQVDLSSLILGDNSTTNKELDGILTRPTRYISVELSTTLTEHNQQKPLPLNILVADVNKLIVVPVKRTAFVKLINKIGIQDGIIISNEITNPSSVEGFISIPINIAKAIISIPGQLLQFRFDNTKKLEQYEKEKLTYDQSLLATQKFDMTKEHEIGKIKFEMQKTELTNQTALEKLKVELQKTDLTNQTALEKLKVELQTGMLEAEKKQAETQKNLDEINKKLQALQAGK